MLLINRTYTTITPESAEQGDSAESGFEAQNEPVTFRELVDLMREHSHPSHGLRVPADITQWTWFASGSSVQDYRTLEEKETAIHYSRDNAPRKLKYWALAARAAGLTH